MQRYFRQLEITPKKRMDYFIHNLKMGLRESASATHPKNLSDAMEVARKAEDMYASLSKKQEEAGNEI
jgi:hypothetical protein